MRLVHGLKADVMDAIQVVQQVPLGIDIHLVDRRHDLADDLLAGGSHRMLASFDWVSSWSVWVILSAAVGRYLSPAHALGATVTRGIP